MYKIPTKRLIFLRIITIVIIPFALLWSLISGFNIIYTRAPVNGLSMYPTLNEQFEITNKNDVVYINNFGKFYKNDIVVMDLRKHPDFGNFTIKRLIATSGDVVSIAIESNHYALRVNNELIYTKEFNEGLNTYLSFENYTKEHMYQTSRVLKLDNGGYGVKVNQGEVFVLGDNWNVSKDSAMVGPVSQKTILGKVRFIIHSNQNEFISILKQIF